MQNEADRELIRTYPQIFPNFYLLPTPGLERRRILELREFLLMASERLRWLLVALHRHAGVMEIFDAWRERRQALHPDLSGWSVRHYYMLEASRNDFIQFVDERLAEFPDPAVRALVSYHRALVAADAGARARPEDEPVSGPILRNHVPFREPKAHVLELDWDIQRVIDALKRDEPPLARQRRKYYRTEESGGVRRLIEINALVHRALELCDGSHTVKEFTARMAPQFDCASRLRRYAAECLLEDLRKEGLISIYAPESQVKARAIGAGSAA